eukprot:15309380-Ditylum_brightwellii.AAC.1
MANSKVAHNLSTPLISRLNRRTKLSVTAVPPPPSVTMTINAPSIDMLTISLPHPVLPSMVGQPTYHTIYELHTLFMENTSTVPFTIGGGNHGHLGLIIEAPKYLQLTGVAFAAPPNPGPVPLARHPFMTQAEIKNEQQIHCAALVTFQTYHNCNKALRNQIIAAVEERYIKALRQRMVGYSNRTSYKFLAHLYLHYDMIAPVML